MEKSVYVLLYLPLILLLDLLHYHMIPNVICPIAIEQREVIPNMSGKNLTLNRDINGTIFVNDVKISDSYIMARNGILYLIDDVILPKQGTVNLIEFINM